MIEAFAVVAEKTVEVASEKVAEVAAEKVAKAVSKAGDAIEAKVSEKISSKSFDPRKPLEVDRCNSLDIDQQIFDPKKPLDAGRSSKETLKGDVLDSIINGEKNLETSQEKGNFGEMMTDRDLKEKGYERISLEHTTDLSSPGRQGIDGVYYKKGGNPEYMIVDSKYGSAQLGDTVDGKQMSDKWIDNRLDNAVGKEKADEIRMEKLINNDNVGSYVAHVDEKGTVTYDRLNDNADVIERNVQI